VECVLKLESNGAEVVNVVCDGAKPNRNFWTRLGIKAKPVAETVSVDSQVKIIQEMKVVNKVISQWKCGPNLITK